MYTLLTNGTSNAALEIAVAHEQYQKHDLMDAYTSQTDAPDQWLPARQQDWILAACPAGTIIQAAVPFPERTQPLQITLQYPRGNTVVTVLRSARNWSGVVTEARLLPVLAQHGLPVPTVLGGPWFDPDAQDARRSAYLLTTLMPGQNLQQLSCQSPAELQRACDLLIEAVMRLHARTPIVLETALGRMLPRRDLLHELQAIHLKRGAWHDSALFRHASIQLQPVLAALETPLVFTNGDYQPENFLANSHGITAILDFELARFEDPLYGFAKYPVYDMQPMQRTGIVERYLQHVGLTERDFAPRLALRCLWTLQREIACNDAPDPYRDHVVSLLLEALARL